MFAKDYRQAAWKKLSGKWGNAILAVLVAGLITGGLSATGVGAIIVSGPLALGLACFFLAVSRSSDPKLETIFSGFNLSFVSSLLAQILIAIFTFLWSLLFIIPGIIKAISYSMTFYVIADNPEMSATEAVKESRKIMHGNKWRFFCLQFSFIGWILLSVLTCGILMLWIAPYMQAANAEFYESIKPQAVQAETPAV